MSMIPVAVHGIGGSTDSIIDNMVDFYIDTVGSVASTKSFTFTKIKANQKLIMSFGKNVGAAEVPEIIGGNPALNPIMTGSDVEVLDIKSETSTAAGEPKWKAVVWFRATKDAPTVTFGQYFSTPIYVYD